jgi:hypothetical protein
VILDQTARKLLEALNYEGSSAEIERLSAKLKILENAGLTALTKRLLEGGRKIVDTIKELNLAVQIIECARSAVRLEYEPEGPVRPPDFRVSTEGMTFWIQLKNLSSLERENRQGKLVEQIRRAVAQVPVGRYLTISIARDFTEDEGRLLVVHLARAAKTATDDVDYPFSLGDRQRGSYSFEWPRTKKLEALTLVASADLEFIDLTDLAPNQIRNSVRNAAGAFTWPTTPSVINLIALDCNMYDDIDLCDAVYGTEFSRIGPHGSSWSREPNGFFAPQAPNTNVAGILSLRSIDRSPVSDYSIRCFVNELYTDRLAEIGRLLPIKPTIHYNMRPEPLNGDFDEEQHDG